jgi:2',3'-cyclic-nucleotide 2'-phosphodiesterase / 3'-nucleotidase
MNKTGLFLIIIAGCSLLDSCSTKKQELISIFETTDVHGAVFPFDFIEQKSLDVSLANAATYLSNSKKADSKYILLDNGDNLQGQPGEYYYNFIDTLSPHLNAEIMNYLGYDAACVGNHDIETGHSVYDRIRKEYRFPLLAANAVDILTGKPYFKSYIIINKYDVKIAVMGLITPAVPYWLPEKLYSGIKFRNMLETAEEWMPVILSEKPDLVVGLFHSGWDRSYTSGKSDSILENGSAEVAYNVPGFDIIFNGHDHEVVNERIINTNGDTVLILDGGSRSEKIARADIILTKKGLKGRKMKRVTGIITDLKAYSPDNEYINKFSRQYQTVNEFVNRVIGTSTASICSKESYFGSSAFVDLVHSVQLKTSGADISFSAPLTFNTCIKKGAVKISDMFKLYRFENMLYTLKMSGEEIKNYLEYSYAGWFNTIKGPEDLLIKLKTGNDGNPYKKSNKVYLQNPPYDFD